MLNIDEKLSSVIATAMAKKFAHGLKDSLAQNEQLKAYLFRRFGNMSEVAQLFAQSGAYLLSGGIDQIQNQNGGMFGRLISEVGSDLMAEFGHSISTLSAHQVAEVRRQFPGEFIKAVDTHPDLTRAVQEGFPEKLGTLINSRIRRMQRRSERLHAERLGGDR